MEETTIFVKVLEYGEKIGEKGATLDEFKSWAYEQQTKQTNDMSSEKSLEKLFDECFVVFDLSSGSGNKRILKIEYYFRLLEFRELMEARYASISANKNAFRAIALSVFAIIVSALTTFVQINTPISINQKDLSSLLAAEENLQPQEVVLDKNQFDVLLDNLSEINRGEVKIDEDQYNKILSESGSGSDQDKR